MSLTADKLLFSIFLLLWVPASFAERADRDKPIHLEADQVILDETQHTSTFIGNVRLSQGTLLISGDKIVVTEDKEGFKHATAYGNTAEFRQKREGLEGYVEGYGDRIDYDSRTGTLNFLENARLKRDRDEVSGNNITYNVKTEIFRVKSGDANQGNDQSQRVRAVLQPKTGENAAPPPANDALPVAPDANSSPSQ